MRRLMSILLLISMFILPLTMACVPSGYENENPNRPPNMQSPSAEDLQGSGDGAPPPGADEGAGDEGESETGGEDTGE